MTDEIISLGDFAMAREEAARAQEQAKLRQAVAPSVQAIIANITKMEGVPEEKIRERFIDAVENLVFHVKTDADRAETLAKIDVLLAADILPGPDWYDRHTRASGISCAMETAIILDSAPLFRELLHRLKAIYPNGTPESYQVSARDLGGPFLCWAATYGAKNCVLAMKEEGFDPNLEGNRCSLDGPPLYEAVKRLGNGDEDEKRGVKIEIADILLDMGADPRNGGSNLLPSPLKIVKKAAGCERLYAHMQAILDEPYKALHADGGAPVLPPFIKKIGRNLKNLLQEIRP